MAPFAFLRAVCIYLDPAAAQEFAVTYLGGRAIPQPHDGGNGTCALIKWVTFDETCTGGGTCYELHFVNLFSHRVGPLTLQVVAPPGSLSLLLC